MHLKYCLNFFFFTFIQHMPCMLNVPATENIVVSERHGLCPQRGTSSGAGGHFSHETQLQPKCYRGRYRGSEWNRKMKGDCGARDDGSCNTWAEAKWMTKVSRGESSKSPQNWEVLGGKESLCVHQQLQKVSLGGVLWRSRWVDGDKAAQGEVRQSRQ